MRKIRNIEIEYKEDLDIDFFENLIETAMPVSITCPCEDFYIRILKQEISLIDCIFLLVDIKTEFLVGYMWLKKQERGFWKLHKIEIKIQDSFTDIEKHLVSKIIQDQNKIQVNDEVLKQKLIQLDYLTLNENNIFSFDHDYFSSFEMFYYANRSEISYKGLEWYFDRSKPINIPAIDCSPLY